MGEVVTSVISTVIDVFGAFGTGIDIVRASFVTFRNIVYTVLVGVYSLVSRVVEGILKLWSFLPDWLGGGKAARASATLGTFREELNRELGSPFREIGDAWGRVFSSNNLGAQTQRWLQGIREAAARNRQQTNTELAQLAAPVAPVVAASVDRINMALRGITALPAAASVQGQVERINRALAVISAAPAGANIADSVNQINAALGGITGAAGGQQFGAQVAQINSALAGLNAGPAAAAVTEQIGRIRTGLDGLLQAGLVNGGAGRNLFAAQAGQINAGLNAIANAPAGANVQQHVTAINQALASIQAPPGGIVAAEIDRIRRALAALQQGGAAATGFNLALAHLQEEAKKINDALPVEKTRKRLAELNAMFDHSLISSQVHQDQSQAARAELLSAFGSSGDRTPVDKYLADTARLSEALGRLSGFGFNAADAMEGLNRNIAQAMNLDSPEMAIKRFEDRIRELRKLAEGPVKFSLADAIQKDASTLLGFDVRTPLQIFQQELAKLDTSDRGHVSFECGNGPLILKTLRLPVRAGDSRERPPRFPAVAPIAAVGCRSPARGSRARTSPVAKATPMSMQPESLDRSHSSSRPRGRSRTKARPLPVVGLASGRCARARRSPREPPACPQALPPIGQLCDDGLRSRIIVFIGFPHVRGAPGFQSERKAIFRRRLIDIPRGPQMLDGEEPGELVAVGLTWRASAAAVSVQMHGLTSFFPRHGPSKCSWSPCIAAGRGI
jgi:hypothetical protein